MPHRSSRARHRAARHRSGRHRSVPARSRLSRPALPLGDRLGRPAVVCSLAVVALGVSSVLTQGAPSPTATATGGSPMSLAALLQDGSGGALTASAAERPGTAGGPGTTVAGALAQRAGSSPLDPSAAPPRTYDGELPVNTIVAPAQPATVLEGGRFGWRTAPDLGIKEFHNGTDLSVPSGTPVVAAAEGRVTAVFWDVWGGNRVEVAHADGLRTTYSHLEDVRVEVGDELTPAQRLGSVGATGIRVTGAHLHFETWVDGAVVDPQSFDWVTDAGIVPGTATPYSLAEDAPTPAEISELLRRSLPGGDRIQVMASSPAPARAAERPSAAPESPGSTRSAPAQQPRDDSGKAVAKTPVEQKAEQKAEQPGQNAPAATGDTAPAPSPRPEREPSAAEPEAQPEPARPTTEPVARPAPAPTRAPAEQPAQEPVAQPAPAEEPVPATPAPEPTPAPAETPEERAEREAAEQAAQRAEELRRDQRLHASPTADTDGDGVVDSLDDDLDGDGIVNALDTDIDGDGILNADETGPEQVWQPAAPEGGAPSEDAAAPAAGA